MAIIITPSEYDKILTKVDKIPLMNEGFPSVDVIKERYLGEGMEVTVETVAYFEYLLIHDAENDTMKKTQKFVQEYLKENVIVQSKRKKQTT